MKMRKDRGHCEWRPAFDASMDFFGYVIDENQKVSEGVTRHGVELRWRKVFGTVLKYFGLPKGREDVHVEGALRQQCDRR